MRFCRFLMVLLAGLGSARAQKCFGGWYKVQTEASEHPTLILLFDPRKFLVLDRMFLAELSLSRTQAGVFQLSLTRKGSYDKSAQPPAVFVWSDKPTPETSLFLNVRFCSDSESRPVFIRAVPKNGEPTALFVEPRP
jgi:hypothetical protein